MNWKKIMAVGLAAVSMMAFVSGCGSDTKNADTQLPKKIVIGLDDSFRQWLKMIKVKSRLRYRFG